MLKYPWLRGTEGERTTKWGAYSSERAEFDFARRLVRAAGDARSLEAELMDWADDVAYAVHDVEDFYRAGLIPLDKVSIDPIERKRFVDAELERNAKLTAYGAENLAQAFDGLMEISPIFEPYRGSAEGRARLRSFTSSLVDRYVRAVSLSEYGDGTEKPGLVINHEARMEVAMLKGLTWQYVIESRALITQRYGQKQLVGSLFQTLCDAGASRSDRKIFPEFYREALGQSPDNASIVRTVIDLISSLTEPQVVALQHRLAGVSLGAALDPILP